MENKNDLLNCLDEKIQSGWHMIDKLDKIQIKCNGIDKLSRKIAQEIRFLEKVYNNYFNCILYKFISLKSKIVIYFHTG